MTELREFVKRKITEAREREKEQTEFIQDFKKRNIPRTSTKPKQEKNKLKTPSFSGKLSYRSGSPLPKLKSKNRMAISLSRI